MNLKSTRADGTDFWTGKLRFDVGAVVMAPDFDPSPDCGGGIHYSAGDDEILIADPVLVRVVEVEPVGETIAFAGAGGRKSKAAGVRVVREVPLDDPEVRRRPLSQRWVYFPPQPWPWFNHYAAASAETSYSVSNSQ